MKPVARIIGGCIFAFSFLLLVVPNIQNKVSYGILGMFVGFYILSGLVFWDLKKEIEK